MPQTFKKGFLRNAIDALSTAGIRRGIGPSQRYLLTVPGRKSHMPHTTPVSVVMAGSDLFLVGPYGEVGWVKNARTAGSVALARHGESHTYSLTPVQGPEAASILKRYLQLEPITRPYFSVRSDAPPDAFLPEVQTHPVFKLTRAG